MTTIKLNKKPEATQIKASKAPVRRTDAAKRDRTVAPSKAAMPARDETQAGNNERSSNATESPANKAGQRNHRYDGKLRDESAENNYGDSADALAAAHFQAN